MYPRRPKAEAFSNAVDVIERLRDPTDPSTKRTVMTHKYRGSILVLSISKSVEPNEEQKEMISGFQQCILC